MARNDSAECLSDSQICQACERNLVEIHDPRDDVNSPYAVCMACHERLLQRSLRPIECFNLAKRYGWWQYLLHGDFYLEDGTATQPEIDVEEPELFPAPQLSSVSSDLNRLLDFTITQWSLNEPLEFAWHCHSREAILPVLTRRYSLASNAGIKSTILFVAAKVLGERGAEFVRAAWNDYPLAVHLHAVAAASAACLPFREGFDRVQEALARLGVSERRQQMNCLMEFHSPETLDWIEANACSPVTDYWSFLAAGSQFDWPRFEKWIARGRPLSLIALDVLGEIIRPQSFAMQKYRPRLINPPQQLVLEETLKSYLNSDPVPRVRKMTEVILKYADRVTAADT
jgi:hypothetical protein